MPECGIADMRGYDRGVPCRRRRPLPMRLSLRTKTEIFYYLRRVDEKPRIEIPEGEAYSNNGDGLMGAPTTVYGALRKMNKHRNQKEKLLSNYMPFYFHLTRQQRQRKNAQTNDNENVYERKDKMNKYAGTFHFKH